MVRENIIKYVGVPHSYMGINCLTIIHDFYKNELNIDCIADLIPKDIDEAGRRWISKITLPQIEEWALIHGTKVNLTDAQDFDVIVFKSPKYERPIHFGMFLKPCHMPHLEEGKHQDMKQLQPSGQTASMQSIDTIPWYNKYLGFPYRHLGNNTETGIDCFNLCRLVYKEELGIEIPYDTAYWCNIVDEDWYNKTQDRPFDKGGTEAFGWQKVKDLEKFNVITMSIGATNVTNHCALYIGENKMLQTMIEHKSWIAPYGRWYKNYTVGIYKWIWYAKLIEDMNNHALRDYPLEACGVILKDFSYVPCLNVSDYPKDTFILDPSIFIKQDENIWGIFHSHPGSEQPIPSQDDKISAAFQEYKFLVGFNMKFFIYWMDNKIDALKFEPFEEKHCVVNN